MSELPPICACDDHRPPAPANPPGLDHIAFRAGTYRQVRRALLTRRPGETMLQDWRPGGEGDLGVMLLEWWAYLADILTFYDEQAANEAYLRTAARPGSVDRLVKLLGYRPRPAIGAHGVLAAVVGPPPLGGGTPVAPKGLQVQSKPGPGQEAQTFELDQDVALARPAAVPARPVERLLAPVSNQLTLAGEVRTIQPGARLLLRSRGASTGALVTVSAVTPVVRPDKSKATTLTVSLSGGVASGARARDYRLDMARESTSLWSYSDALEDPVAPKGGGLLSYRAVHLAGLARQIRPGDPVLFTASDLGMALTTVASVSEVIWYANADDDPAIPPDKNAIPIPHTRLKLADGLSKFWDYGKAGVTVHFGWVEAGRLADQPLETWTGADDALDAVAPARFRFGQALPVLIEDAVGAGVPAQATALCDDEAHVGGLPSPVPALQTPLKVYYDLLPVSRGKTVPQEVLGSGDARIAGQSFMLAKSPVTYLAMGAGWASTVEIRVQGRLWREVESFYGQRSDAQVFVLSQDAAGKTWAAFGDGVNGARLPTGANNVVARYRFGAGAAAPPAGKLTTIATPTPGLLALRNPVAVGGGADPDPPDQVRRYAPRSVLTFGRAVSVLDYEALAAQAPGVTRARVAWGWDEVRQRAAVTVYVGDDAAALTSAGDVLKAAGDPNRPISVKAAKPLPTRLTLKLLADPVAADPAAVQAGVVAALTGAGGLFTPERLRIGQPVFESAIAAAVLGVTGAVAILEIGFAVDKGAGFVVDPAPLHTIGEGSWFDLPPERVSVVTVAGEGAHG